MTMAFIACTSKSDTAATGTSYTADKPSGVMGGVGTGVVAAGNSAGKTALGGNAVASLMPLPTDKIFSLLMRKAFAAGEGIDGRCNAHAWPLVAGTSTQMNSSQADYGAMSFFCRVAKNTGDSESVQGSYSLLKGIACALENAGIDWDNTPHSKTITIDTNCFSAAQVSNIGAASMSITVQAAKPAPFNSYYDAGAILTIPSFGIYKLGAKINGTKIEFGGSEDQSSIYAHKWGAYAGQYDTSTGDLRFETRSDRFGAPTSTGSPACGNSCGFGFHMRLTAKLSFDSSGNPTDISTVSGIISNIGRNDDSYNNLHGEIITATGDLSTTGVKIRHFTSSPANGAGHAAELADPTSYTENNAAGGCYTNSSNAANTCGAGIGLGSSTIGFVMAGTIAGGTNGTYTDAVTWIANLTSGLTFSTVTLSDTQ